MVMVSVVIPVYNAQQYIKECLDSVLGQTMNELEIICVDDGSTDSSLSILEEYERSDPRVHVSLQENQGSGPARNKGMELAQGRYIVFLDADDLWHDGHVLEKIVKAAEENGSSVTGAFWGEYKDGRYKRSKLHAGYFQDGGDGRWIDFREEQDCMGYCSYLFRRDFLIHNKILFPAYYRFQDPPFLTKALILVREYYVIPIDWHCYRTIYKDTLSTVRKTTDFVKGVIDVMGLAQMHHLDRLTDEMIRQIDEFSQSIINSILQGNAEMLCLLGEVHRYAARKKVVEPIRFLKDAAQERCMLKAKGFLDRVNSVDRLVIYGAGKYGHLLLGWIESADIGTEIIFAETERPKTGMVDGRECIQIDQLAESSEDMLVVIAVTPEMQPQLAENLLRLGIRDHMLLDRDLMTALEFMSHDHWSYMRRTC